MYPKYYWIFPKCDLIIPNMAGFHHMDMEFIFHYLPNWSNTTRSPGLISSVPKIHNEVFRSGSIQFHFWSQESYFGEI